MQFKLNYIAFAFLLIGSISWGIVYVLMIRKAYQDKVIAYPLLSNMINWSWETHYTFIKPSLFLPSLISNIIWLILNTIILLTYFKFTTRNRIKSIGECFIIFMLLILSIEWVTDIYKFKNNADLYVLTLFGFISSFAHVLSHIYRLKILKSTRGQSLTIALVTLIGNFSYVLEILIHPAHKDKLEPIILFFMVGTLVGGVYYYFELKKNEFIVQS